MSSPLPPRHVGIRAIEAYVPLRYVDQSELEQADGVSTGKYTAGLGQTRMAFVDDREDVVSMSLTVVQALLEKHSIDPRTIGRLEVGTESMIDKSKSVKSHLMQLFLPDNPHIEGIDTVNACYGGVSALFNAVQWMQSAFWDGRLAIVVAVDIAVYAPGPARPTGGAGAVAVLVGPDAPLVLEPALRGTHMAHDWDFYKPDLHSEYPRVDGRLSVSCFLRSLDSCYQRYLAQLRVQSPESPASVQAFDYVVFHAPYAKLVKKSLARLYYNDFLNAPNATAYAALQAFKGLDTMASYTDRDLERALLALSRDTFDAKVAPSLEVTRCTGNSYCATLFLGLASLLRARPEAQLVGARIGLFSYGSGSAASFFSLRVHASPAGVLASAETLPHAHDASRIRCTPAQLAQALALREIASGRADHDPQGPEAMVAARAYVVDGVRQGRGQYRRRSGS